MASSDILIRSKLQSIIYKSDLIYFKYQTSNTKTAVANINGQVLDKMKRNFLF